MAAYATIASISLNLLLNIVLIWEFGIVGAAIATTISFAANTTLHIYYLNRFIDINLPLKEVGGYNLIYNYGDSSPLHTFCV
uniref:polysaccharide biosynthesis C-terminal domain-containing protein n=1 Tax=Natrinema pellirubrum TaxID=69525 RepID=UPI001FD3C16D|nr:polysaccharide biosynthesis C-terminal domain-containing protein [Natrinema pellirubrum]